MDKQLLEVLACPVSHGALEYDAENQRLICRASRLAYPVRDGIPVLLETEAEAWSAEQQG